MKKILKPLAAVSFTVMLGYAGTIDRGGPLLPNIWWVVLSLLSFCGSVIITNRLERSTYDTDKKRSAEDSGNCQQRRTKSPYSEYHEGNGKSIPRQEFGFLAVGMGNHARRKGLPGVISRS